MPTLTRPGNYLFLAPRQAFGASPLGDTYAVQQVHYDPDTDTSTITVEPATPADRRTWTETLAQAELLTHGATT